MSHPNRRILRNVGRAEIYSLSQLNPESLLRVEISSTIVVADACKISSACSVPNVSWKHLLDSLIAKSQLKLRCRVRKLTRANVSDIRVPVDRMAITFT